MRIHGTIQRPPARGVRRPTSSHAAAGAGSGLRRADLQTVKVHRDFHVEVAQGAVLDARALIGAKLDARADRELVQVLFHRGQLVKTHPRQPPGGRSTDPDDLPEEKAGYAMRDLTG